MAPLIGLNHWMLHDDRLAREFDGILKLSPGYDPLRLPGVGANLSFFANLISDVNSPVGQINGSFGRNSQGIYRAPMGTTLGIAGDNVSRHEYSEAGEPIGLLFEPATTNVCENFNANPDAAFLNMSITVGTGTLSREEMSAELAAAGLAAVCPSGFAFKIDSPSGFTDVTIAGPTNAAGTFNLSAYIYCPQGSGFLALNFVSGAVQIDFESNTGFERVQGNNTVTQTIGEWRIRADSGSVVYFVLNQVESNDFPTSPIITDGGAASRAVDRLTYPTIDINSNPIINQTEGMHALIWRPQFNRDDAGLSNQRLSSVDTAWAFYDNLASAFKARSGASTDVTSSLAQPLAKGKDYLIMVEWSGAEFSVGHKVDGVTVWSAPGVYAGILDSGIMTLHDLVNDTIDVPGNLRYVYIWSENEGQAWLENFFAGVAN